MRLVFGVMVGILVALFLSGCGGDRLEKVSEVQRARVVNFVQKWCSPKDSLPEKQRNMVNKMIADSFKQDSCEETGIYWLTERLMWIKAPYKLSDFDWQPMVETAPQMSHFYFEDAQIGSISELDVLKSFPITHLSLKKNKLQNLDGFDWFADRLEFLNISENNLQAWNNTKVYPKMVRLEVMKAELKDAPNLKNFPVLKKLFLAENKNLKTIDNYQGIFVEGAPKLELLDVSKNDLDLAEPTKDSDPFGELVRQIQLRIPGTAITAERVKPKK